MEKEKIDSANKKFDLNLLLKILFISSLVGFGIYVILLIIFTATGSDLMFSITCAAPFSDFAEVLAYAICPNPFNGAYGIACIYPPISFIIFYPLTWICRAPLDSYVAGEITLSQLSANPLFIVSFVIYYLIHLAIILWAVSKLSKFKGKNLIYLLTIVFCFGPLLFSFIRGNNTLSVATLALLFFALNSSEKRWQKELSYVCLAGAISFKIYPALMMFYLIYKEVKLEKLWSVLKTLGYSLILIFLPFVFFEGGFSNIPILFNNVMGFSNPTGSAVITNMKTVVSTAIYSGVGPRTWGSNISLDTIIYWFCVGLSYIFGNAHMATIHSTLSSLLRYVFLLFVVVLPFLGWKSNKLKEYVTLSVGAYLLWPGVCNGYCMAVMIIPFVFTVLNWNEMKLSDKIFNFVCYFLIINPVFFMYGWFWPSAVAVLCLVVKSIVDILKDICLTYKNKKSAKSLENDVEVQVSKTDSEEINA